MAPIASELIRTSVADADAWHVEVGTSRGPAVVLVPGLTDGLAPLFRPGAAERLSTVPLRFERLRALAVSYPTPLPSPCSTRALADLLAVVLERLLDGPAVLVGHSMGGMVAQHLAAARPELVRGMVLSATTSRTDASTRATLARWDALLGAGDFEGFARDAIDRSFTGDERDRRRRTLREEGVDEVPPAYVGRHLSLSAACAVHDAVDRLAAIRAPTLVLAGAEDEVIPQVHAHRLASALPDARLHVFARGGHGFPEQEASGYRREVEPFLARLLGSE